MAAYFAMVQADDTPAEKIVRTGRCGEMVPGQACLQIRSTNRRAGSIWPSDTPIGYLLDLDARTVAGIELNGTRPTLFLLVAAEPETHRSALIASLAPAVFWNPANLDARRLALSADKSVVTCTAVAGVRDFRQA